MNNSAMVDPIDDIARQARQGSVSAIIQVLNEKLADSSVRTRAVLEDGILQLLCEAPQLEQLEQSVLVEQVRDILESISPRNIRRVNINSRIVREQQLLWLQEIQRDPKNQLLWSQEIILKRPNLFKQFLEDWEYNNKLEAQQPKAPKRRSAGERQQFWRGMLVGGFSLALFLALIGWALTNWLRIGTQLSTNAPPANAPPANSPTAPAPASPGATVPAAPAPAPGTSTDPFAQAVRLAEQSARDGQLAQTRVAWLDLASRWQQASDLMGQVPPTDPRYPTAQNRQQTYLQNSQAAQQKAAALQ